MKTAFQRRIDRYFGTPLCLLLSFFNYFRIKSTHSFKPKKILVILLSEMGSLILAKPMFDRLIVAHPSAEIYMLISKKNEETVQLINVVSDENIITIRDATLVGFFVDSVKVLMKMRRLGIDTVLDCELFSRISSILSFLSGAKLRVGFYSYTQEGLYRGSFINRQVLYNPYMHISKQFISLVESLEADTVPILKRQIERGPGSLLPLPVDKQEFEKWKRRFENDFPWVAGSKLILLYPSGGLLPLRAWPLDNYRSLAKYFIGNGYAVGILGMNDDKKLADAILSYCEHEKCIDLTGYTKTIRELLHVFHYAVLLVANDGGPGHIAALTQVPAVIIYGPETPALYASLSEKATAMYHAFSCSPCLTAYNQKNSPCDGNNLCLKNITVAEVLVRSQERMRKQRTCLN